ncbi:cyclic-phosphate processing receiver domain-containing protein [Methylobacterium marchantiae]|uniref:Cyclic-phosphate processing receiver domain-containing protein n=1 Tax=Methylobacterium marchantiae TaxID=600331 RepID=A0ABW3X196_9HYPH|nr:hypothetical protein AIGOOFII_0681 [Methylobacterium marchantiae]
MSYRLFLDDERDPPSEGDWDVVRSLEAAQAVVLLRGMPAFVSFDHDLGADDDGKPLATGADFAHWLGGFVLDNGLSLNGFTWSVHSQNPIGAANIDGYLRNLVEWLDRGAR